MSINWTTGLKDIRGLSFNGEVHLHYSPPSRRLVSPSRFDAKHLLNPIDEENFRPTLKKGRLKLEREDCPSKGTISPCKG